jgi:type I restriction enzyme M protein
MVDRVHAELTDQDVAKVVGTYHAWRGDPGAKSYSDSPGFAKTATIREIRAHKYVLCPGRYVGFDRSHEPQFSQSEMNGAFMSLLARFHKSQIASESALKTLKGIMNG